MSLDSVGFLWPKKHNSYPWYQVALVIDRLLLLIFFLAMTIASLVILTSSPHFQVTYTHSSQHFTPLINGYVFSETRLHIYKIQLYR